MNVKVEIYTRQYCTLCERAKDLLRIKGVSFAEHDITDDHLKAAEMRQHSQKQNVPNIFIDDVSIGSCTELFDLDERGALDSLLGLEPRRVTLSPDR